MISSSISIPAQSVETTTGFDVDQILLKAECLPFLIGVSKFRHLTALITSADTSNIAKFILSNRKCPDIELYWSQASKFLSGAKPAAVQSSKNLHCAKAADHFWMVLHEITQRRPAQSDDSTNIFSDRGFTKILNSVLPILISCFPVSELPLLLKPLFASNLSSEHISNIAVNLPFICRQISEVLQTYLRDAQEPSLIWRSSRILLKVASRDKQLAVSVRNSLVKWKEHPLLCLNVTREFVHDTEEFIDKELCSRLISSVSSSWLLLDFKDSHLLVVSHSAADKLNALLCRQRGDFIVEDQRSLFAEITQCARIISTCCSVHGCDVTQKSTAYCSYEQVEVIRNAIAALLGAAEGALQDSHSRPVLCPSDNANEEFAEMALRLAIALVVVNFFELAATDTKTRREGTSLWAEGALHREESALSALLVSALRMQRRLVDRPSTSTTVSTRESTKSFSLSFRLAVTFGSSNALRSLCVRELSLEHYSDFLVECDMAKAIGILARVIVSPERVNQRDRDKTFCDEFRALRQPHVISGASEVASDWMTCLSLMLSCNLLEGVREEGIEDGILVSDPGSTHDESSDDFSSGCSHTHKLMISVLRKARWPPHSLLLTCVDKWLLRCVGVRSRIGSSYERIGGANREYPRLGLPLLRAEAQELTRGLLMFQPTAAPICGLCKGVQLRKRGGVGVCASLGGGSVCSSGISEECQKFLKYHEIWTAVDSTVSAADETERRAELKVYSLQSDCICDVNECAGERTSDLDDDTGWSGVVACYTALQYATLSMSLTTDASAGPEMFCEAVYLGPFVCDIRCLPIKRSIQYMLLKHLPTQPLPSLANPADTTRTAAAAALMMNKIMELAGALCPELLVHDRGGCFTCPDMALQVSPQAALPCIPDQGDQTESLLHTWVSLIAPTDTGPGSDRVIAQYKTASELVRSPQFILSLSSDSLPASITNKFLQQLLHFAFQAGADRQRSAGLWTVWRALHDIHPSPQQLELLSLNYLFSSIQTSPPRILTSYEQLVQDPLQLFNLPIDALSSLFSLRLIVFITRSALVASKCAVRLALAIRHEVAKSFVTATVRRRSTTEASLYLHEETFLDLQDLMAVRLLLGLWGAWSDVSDGSDGEKRIVLNDFVSSLVESNPRLCSLMLFYQLAPRSLELLLSCDSSIVLKISATHLQIIQDITQALRTLPEASAIVIDPLITSSTLTFAATFSAASALATSKELCPEDLERLLMHSLCILRLSRKCSTSGDHAKMKDKDRASPNPATMQLAEALPTFLICATNSLNAHLGPNDVKGIEQLSLSIVYELFGHFPVYAEPLRDFALKPEAVATANTAAINMVVKTWHAKGHQKAEEDVIIKARPAIVALRKIVKKVEQLHPRPQILLDPSTQTPFQTQIQDPTGDPKQSHGPLAPSLQGITAPAPGLGLAPVLASNTASVRKHHQDLFQDPEPL